MTIPVYNELGPGGTSSLTPYFSSYVNSYSLSANTAKTITWPTGAQFCNIVGDGHDYFASTSGTATVPVGDVTTGLASARNVAQRQRGTESTFSIISATSQVLTIEFWSGNSSF